MFYLAVMVCVYICVMYCKKRSIYIAYFMLRFSCSCSIPAAVVVVVAVDNTFVLMVCFAVVVVFALPVIATVALLSSPLSWAALSEPSVVLLLFVRAVPAVADIPGSDIVERVLLPLFQEEKYLC